MSLFGRWFRRRERDEAIDKELRFHVEQQIADYAARGLSREEAARRTRLEFGGTQQVKEEIREMNGRAAVDTLVADLRYAARALRRSPGFTLAAMVALAVGSGGTTAVASILNDLVRKPPRLFHNARELVVVSEASPRNPAAFDDVAPAVYEEFLASRTLSALTALRELTLLVRIDGSGAEREPAFGTAVSPNLFDVLGIAPALGRGFAPGEDRLEAAPVALLSYGYWQRRFAGSSEVLQRRIEIGGRSHAIVGILPRGYALAYGGDVFVPLSAEWQGAREGAELFVVARRMPGTDIEQVRAELTALQRGAEPSLRRGPGWGLHIDPMRGRTGTGGRGMALIWPLFLAAALVTLLVTSANLAILMVARGMSRVKEAAVRAALGASRFRLMQQVLLEALLLAAGGGVLGVLVSVGLSRALLALGPGAVPAEFDLRFDPQVFGFAAAVVIVAGIASGLSPAVAAARTDVVDALKGMVWPGQRPRRLRSALVIAEIGLTMTQLVGVGLLLRGYTQYLDLNPGFARENLLTIRLEPVAESERTGGPLLDREMASRLRALPGVVDVSVSSVIPPLRGGSVQRFSITGQNGERTAAVGTRADVDANFFETIGVRLLRGQPFDTDAGNEQVVISDVIARRLWPSAAAVGQFLQLEGETRAKEIVGVVSDIYRSPGTSREAIPYLYRLRNDGPGQPGAGRSRGSTYVLLRTAQNSAALAPAVRSTIEEMFPNRPSPAPETLDALISRAARDMLFAAFLVGPLVVLTLVLSASGIYGLISQTVASRTRELGIRAALGAERRQLVWLVVRDALKLARAGLVVGVLGVVAVNRIVMNLFAGVTWAEPLVVVLAALLMVGVAIAASYRPASRAARVDPMTALRYE
jgi:predicted permease